VLGYTGNLTREEGQGPGRKKNADLVILSHDLNAIKSEVALKDVKVYATIYNGQPVWTDERSSL